METISKLSKIESLGPLVKFKRLIIEAELEDGTVTEDELEEALVEQWTHDPEPKLWRFLLEEFQDGTHFRDSCGDNYFPMMQIAEIARAWGVFDKKTIEGCIRRAAGEYL